MFIRFYINLKSPFRPSVTAAMFIYLFIPNFSDSFSFFLLEFVEFVMILDLKNPQHLFKWSQPQIGLVVGVPFYCVSCISVFLFHCEMFEVGDTLTPFVFRRRQLCVLADFQEQREVSLDVSVGAQGNGRMALNYWPAWQLMTLRLRFLSPSSLFTALTLCSRHIHSESIKAAEGNTKVITVQTHLFLLKNGHLKVIYFSPLQWTDLLIKSGSVFFKDHILCAVFQPGYH